MSRARPATLLLLRCLLLAGGASAGTEPPGQLPGPLPAGSAAPATEAGPELGPEAARSGAGEAGGGLRLSPQLSAVCTCDLTRGSCDLNCCCDPDCSARAGDVFSFCLPGSYRVMEWVCLDNSLIFRSNSPFHSRMLMTDGNQQFCIQVDNPMLNYFQQLQNVDENNIQTFLTKYGDTSFFSGPQLMPAFPSFYRAGDPILIYFPKRSLLSFFKQPEGIGPTGLCSENNAARFLESRTTVCNRIFSNLRSSCTTDPSLKTASYYDFKVLKVPKGVMDLPNMQVPITSTSESISPKLDGNICRNVVSQVTYEIETNGIFGIQKISVYFNLVDLSGNPRASMQQYFTIHFRALHRKTASLPLMRSGNPGYIFGMPILVLKGNTTDLLTISHSHSDGSCSESRRKVGFEVNMLTGCKFRIENGRCDHLQDKLYKILGGPSSPRYLGIVGNSNPSHEEHWVKVFTKNCSTQAKNCTSCCLLPLSLEIVILWADQGLKSNPQAHVFGGQYRYDCHFLTLPSSVREVTLTTSVSFIDITKGPEYAWNNPRINWKSPFNFVFPIQKLISGEMESLRSLSMSVVLLCVLLHEILSLEMN